MVIRGNFLVCFIKIGDTRLFFNSDGSDPTERERSITQERKRTFAGIMS